VNRRFTIAAMHLRKISEATNKAALLKLEYLPTSLKQYYEEAMDKIRQQPVSHFQLALNTFGLLSHAKISLTIDELQEALCIDIGDRKLDISRLTPLPIILNASLGFINNDNQSELVEFFHTTFQEWLLACKELQAEDLQDIGRSCLTYLMLEDFSEPCKSEDLAMARRQQYAFAAYASSFWADHIRGDVESDIQKPLLEFLLSPNLISSVQLLPQAASRDTRFIGKESEWLEVEDSNNHIALYFCICLRLYKTLDVILQRDFEPPFVVSWGERYSPLHAALRLGATEVSNKLIMKGIWTDVQDRRGMTPLHIALEMSRGSFTLSALQLMKDAKARIDLPDYEGRTALHYAIRVHNSQALNYMLNNYTSFDTTSWDVEGNTPLHEAIAQGNSYMVSTLLDKNFSPMVQNRAGKTALAAAIDRGNSDARYIVEAILRAADADTSTFELPAPERAAVATFLKSLEKREAEAKQAKSNKTAAIAKQRMKSGSDRLGALSRASEEGDVKNLVILLLGNVSPNKFDPVSGMTPLHHAISKGQTDAVWHLLASGAKTDIKDSQGLTAKDLAEREGRKGILDMISDRAWMKMERLVGESPFRRELSGRELRNVYKQGNEVVKIIRAHRNEGTSWSYRGTDWVEYLGFRGPRSSPLSF
jgi:ankyrin repeat protein